MNAILRETLSELSARGIQPNVVQNKHLKVSWHNPAGGRRQTLIISVSPSDTRAIKANRALLRRLLREV